MLVGIITEAQCSVFPLLESERVERERRTERTSENEEKGER